MDDISWDIATPEGLFNMLKEDFEDFKKDPLSSKKALHCILTGWHLIDWNFIVYESENFKNLETFRKSLYPKCPNLKIMHDITTRLKHFKVSTPKSNAKDSEVHMGSYSADYSLAYDVSCLKILHNDQWECIEPIINEVIIFWEKYFNHKSLKNM